MQLHTGSPRVWKAAGWSDAELAAGAAAIGSSALVRVTLCHASYLVNLATADRELLAKSRACLAENLRVATGIGTAGLVLHIGSHRGEGFESCVSQVARELCRTMDAADERARRRGLPSCRILIENAAGAGGTVGTSFEEIGAVISAAGGDERLGACVDTQHLFASGVCFASIAEADAVVRALERAVGLERLGCLHLNDSKVPFGARRDRHANLGEGYIGARALGSLLSHPRLQHLAAVLEVPGIDRQGPGRHDLEVARTIRAAGLRRRNRATPLPRREPPPAPGGRTGSRRDR